MKEAYITKPEDQKRHRQFILAVDNSYFETQMCSRDGAHALAFGRPLNLHPFDDFVKEAQSHLVIREREYLDESVELVETRPHEKDGSQPKGCIHYRQVLPYIVARQLQPNGDYLYFPYRRTKGVGEARLAGNGSLGYGGHVDFADVVHHHSVIDLMSTIILATLREMNEEFILVDGAGGELNIEDFDLVKPANVFITDSSAPVHQVHVAVVMFLEVPFGYTLKTKEADQLKDLPPATLEQLKADATFNPELWTQHLMDFFGTMMYSAVNSKIGIDHGGEQVARVNMTTFGRIFDEQGVQVGGRLPPVEIKVESSLNKVGVLYLQTVETLAALDITVAPSISPYEFDGMRSEQLGNISALFLKEMKQDAIDAYNKRCAELEIMPKIWLKKDDAATTEVSAEPAGDSIPLSHRKAEQFAAFTQENIAQFTDYDFRMLDPDQLLAITDQHVFWMTPEQRNQYSTAMHKAIYVAEGEAMSAQQSSISERIATLIAVYGSVVPFAKYAANFAESTTSLPGEVDETNISEKINSISTEVRANTVLSKDEEEIASYTGQTNLYQIEEPILKDPQPPVTLGEGEGSLQKIDTELSEAEVSNTTIVNAVPQTFTPGILDTSTVVSSDTATNNFTTDNTFVGETEQVKTSLE